MRASRLLSILMLLQSRGRMSAHALAGEMEVSVRTVYRDIDQLSAAGVPVWADRGRAGGFQLSDGWQTRLTGLTESEARALFLAGLPGPARELGLGGAMASARLKVLASLPAEWRSQAQRVSSRFHLDPIDWFRAAASTDHLNAVAEAVWSERRMKMRYESWSSVVDREVEPLGIVLKAGVWYMAARPTGGDEVRTYRLGHILELTLTGERFARPRHFDLAAYWRDSTERFEQGIYHDTAVVRVSARGLELLQDFSAVVAAAAMRSAQPDGESEGWVRVRIPIESIEHAASQLLRLGSDAEALEPRALRELMAQTAQRIAALYVARSQAAERPPLRRARA